MSGARLTALRLVGFKSFAERTVVEFGPGISAVVGPNGSGKSNLADALRWTLGEQGRSLRTRRAEDVIFAGSSTRKAIGMADVTLVIDNSDRMLPVDFGELEIGRRLYRSGESEYLLNRQKIRLRDLVELLDAGNIADNAFLFIGQGMVDQALALRPEERRPLFEEAAGVRRHDRRRRQAETELAEAETNLERLRDLLGELRPQARRLAAQAEQLEARRTAGAELADALLAAARARWVTAYETERGEQRQLDQGRAAADAALATLQEAETSAATTAAQMASHAEAERTRRQALDLHRATIVELRVALARLESEIAAISRDTQRVTDERAAVDQRLAASRVSMSLPRPQADPALAEELAALERQLSEATTSARDAEAGSTEPLVRELAGLRLAHDQQAPRAEQLATDHEELRTRLATLAVRLAEAETERDATVERLEALSAAEQAAGAQVEAVRTASTKAAAGLSQVREGLAETEAEAAAIRARRAALEAALASATDEGLARAARGRGAKLVAEGVEIDPRFRRAVSAALDHAAAAFVVDDPAPLVVKNRRGALVLRRPARDRRLAPAAAAFLDAVVRTGGGRIFDSVRRDPQGELTRLLERTVWVADLGAALAIAHLLPPGWRAVTLAGEVINDEGVLRLAGSDSLIEQRAELDSLGRSLAEVDARVSGERDAAEEQRHALATAMAAVQPAQQLLDESRRERRAAEEVERVAQRRAEQFLREVNWERAQLDRLASEMAAARKQAEATAKQIRDLETRLSKPGAKGPSFKEQSKRLAALTARRDKLAYERSAADASVAAWQQEQQIAQVHRAVDEGRLADLEREAQRASSGAAQLSAVRERTGGQLHEAQVREAHAAAELAQVLAAGATDRATLTAAERVAAEARERLRIAEAASRRAEVSSMEARFQLEQIREQLLVELAGIGADGLGALINAAGGPAPEQAAIVHAEGSADVSDGSAADESVASDALESALDRVVRVWQETSVAEQPPSVNRVSVLRRRFHELGAGNPFAAEEYGELRTRLESLEAQRADLESAITSTRELIASLSALISEQFRSTFAALEDAFARRFHELFGGGDAQLSLTTPEDLSATGVEIHARPPGKKRQPLSMLSGGERALTAVSLLLAMLEVRPVPFCVLDEVDAALDEANITRFSKALRGLAKQTQFIVITHNRGTIEGADALYGVTIGDDAVSRVVSLRLPKPEGNGEGPHEMIAEAALV